MRKVEERDVGRIVAAVYKQVEKTKAETKRITTVGTSGNNWIVTDGASPGDRLIVDGFQKFSAGADVVPVEAAIDEDGVVDQDLKAESGK